MQKLWYGLWLLTALLAGCTPKPISKIPVGDNSQNALDWAGVYTGTTPCADCEGIATVITLNNNNTYTAQTQYKGKDTRWLKKSGTFSWNQAGSNITLQPSDGSKGYQYKVGENKLMQLDQSGQVITGGLASNYVLQKDNSGLPGKYWKLIELQGQAIAENIPGQKEPFVVFVPAGNQVVANGSCNGMGGTYSLEGNGRIRFGQMMGTLMACPNMEVETNFSKALQTADSYVIRNDTLVLHRARMAPLARFKAAALPEGFQH